MNLTGNTVFIPGATSGIGLAFARRLHEMGNTVIIGGRRTALLEQITRETPGLHSVPIDTSDPEAIIRVRDGVLREHPDLNVLIPMAGIMLPEDLRDPAHLATVEKTVEVNLLGPIRLISAFLPHLLQQADAAIVTVSSGLAFVPLPLTPTYSATKAGIHSFTESLRVQLQDTAVQVIELIPPGVRTTLMGQQDSEAAMPLDAFVDESIALLRAEPDAHEILVDRVKFLRFAEGEGRYAQTLAMLSGQ